MLEWRCPVCGLGPISIDPAHFPVRHHCVPLDGVSVNDVQAYHASQGAGSQLKRMLSRMWIHTSEGCGCDERAALMDSMGPDWCEEHLEIIIGWLREEANARGLPFIRPLARDIVRRAIRTARRAEIAK